MTIQQMIEQAVEEGASVAQLWGRYMVKVTDEGFWYFVDNVDRRIDEEDARRLLDCFQVGYINLD